MPKRNLGSLSDGAAYAGVSTRTLRRWIAAGRLTGYSAGTRTVRIDLDELDGLFKPIPSAASGGERLAPTA